MPEPRRVFISYRRDDSIVHATLLHDRLAERFGGENVFIDKEDIAIGEDFERAIDDRIAGFDVLVAVVGPRWGELLAAREPGAPDYVRREIARAFARGMRVIPVFVGGATPGEFAAVPPDLARLRTTNALPVRDAEIREDVTALVEAIQGRRFDQIADAFTRDARTRRIARFAGLGVGLAAFFAGWVAVLDLLALDTRFAAAALWLGAPGRLGPGPAPAGDVLLVLVDAATVQRIGRPFDRSWRREHAALVDRLSEAGARTVAFDFFFREADPARDAELSAAIARARARGVAVVLGVDALDGARPQLAPTLAGPATAWGIACAGEKLGIARSMPLAVRRGETAVPSLALAAFGAGGSIEAFDARDAEVRIKSAATGKLADVGFSLVERARAAHAACPVIRAGDAVALQLLAPAPAGFWLDPARRIAYEAVLDSAEAAARASGKHVLVGLALEGKDVVRVSGVPRAGERFGVELHAESLDAILRGDVIRPLGALGQVGVMLVLGSAGAFARRRMARLQPGPRRTLLAGAAIAYVAFVVAMLRSERILMNAPYEIGAFALAYWLMGRIDRPAAAGDGTR
jgi:CHASE2 domain-containing sensor protein